MASIVKKFFRNSPNNEEIYSVFRIDKNKYTIRG